MTSAHSLDRAVVARYFTFLVISQLVIFTLIGVLFSKSPINDSFFCSLIMFISSSCRRTGHH